MECVESILKCAVIEAARLLSVLVGKRGVFRELTLVTGNLDSIAQPAAQTKK